MATHEIKLDPLCEAVFYDGAPIPVGPSSWGTRLILPVLGGTVRRSETQWKNSSLRS